MPVEFTVKYKILIFTYQALQEAPEYIFDVVSMIWNLQSLKLANQWLFGIPRVQPKTKGDCAFTVILFTSVSTFKNVFIFYFLYL